jgi:2-polyprenyl-3-methyl-5-hydroxy-6-metoxy-1,4-benzoquinol methylase
MTTATAASGTQDLGAQGEIAFQARLYTDPNPTRRGLHLDRRAWVETVAAPHVGPGRTALEVGIGCGVFTRFLAERGATVTAIDINQAFLDGVAGVAGITTINADATRPLPIAPVDFALCSEVLEHVPSDRSLAMLHSLHAALKPGGHLLLTTPQRFATVELMARLFRIPLVLALARRIYGTAEELGHINLLTQAQLGEQLAAAGFEIIRHDRFGFYLPVIAEFGGTAGRTLLRGIERLIRPIPGLRGLIWTQAYLLRRPNPSPA